MCTWAALETIDYFIDSIVDYNIERQDYIKLNNIHFPRECFKIKTGMNRLRGNFSNDPENRAKGNLCVGCGEEKEVNLHVMNCSSYSDLKIGRDLANSTDLVGFFQKVMARRLKLEGK